MYSPWIRRSVPRPHDAADDEKQDPDAAEERNEDSSSDEHDADEEERVPILHGIVVERPHRISFGSSSPRSSEREDLVDQLCVGQDHATAAIPFQPERVEDLDWIFSSARPLDERLERAPDDLAAGETPDGDDH